MSLDIRRRPRVRPPIVLPGGHAVAWSERVVSLTGRKPQELRPGELYIGRAMYRGGWALPASKWANPYTAASEGSLEVALSRYRDRVLATPALAAALPELAGATLACWCHNALGGHHCHGDVLVALLAAAAAD